MTRSFQDSFAAHGYHLAHTAKSARLKAVYYHADTLIESLRDEAILRLAFNAKFRKATPFTYSQLLQIAQPSQPDVFYRHVASLVHDSRLMHRGFYLTCHHCTLQHWYPLEGITRHSVCAGCHTLLRIPLDAQLAYKANPLFADALRNGGLTIWLTLAYFRNITPGHRHDVCADVRGHGIHTDIDVVLARADDSRLLLVECKDRLPPAADAALTRQLDHLATLAHSLNADAYLATLDTRTLSPDNLPDGIQVISRQMLLNRT
jgi:hypothetical protein